MGRSDNILIPVYRANFPRIEPIALLGFSNNNIMPDVNDIDLYDLSLENWNINTNWQLKRRYNTIISTRCPYFAKNPEQFITKCYENLNENGQIFLSWDLGGHWAEFHNDYKIGWLHNGYQEWAYAKDNFLWSAVWDDSFLEHKQFQLFCERVKKFGYTDVKKAIFDEVPAIIELAFIKKYFHIKYEMLALWEDYPQINLFIVGVKKNV